MSFAVCSKININKPIVIDIAGCYATAIVVIEIIEDIKLIFLIQFIFKCDIGFGRGKIFKSSFFFFFAGKKE